MKLQQVSGKSILFVMAAEAEYGEHLRQRFTPLITGVGPVEAGTRMGIALARMEARDALPDLVICLGSAGSARLEQTEIYQASCVSYREMDASPLGFAKGYTPFLDLPPVLPLPHHVAGLPDARLSTGANIVSGDTYDGIDADMVDMETFAVLRACMAFDCPLIGLRGISDGAAALKHVDDWTQYLHVIDEKLGDAVDRVEAALASGLLSGLRD